MDDDNPVLAQDMLPGCPGPVRGRRHHAPFGKGFYTERTVVLCTASAGQH